jgi:Lrp/AsnC family transcriptional regulator for asnA, asnC and gidA
VRAIRLTRQNRRGSFAPPYDRRIAHVCARWHPKEGVTDELDRKIIEALQHDGRASHARMARDLSVSEGTVRRRLSRLLQDRIIRVVAIAEPAQLGYQTSAFIGLKVDPARVESVATELANLGETEHVAITTGSYDVFIWVNLASSEALANFLHRKVGTVEGVRQTETFVSLETRKRSAGPGIS